MTIALIWHIHMSMTIALIWHIHISMLAIGSAIRIDSLRNISWSKERHLSPRTWQAQTRTADVSKLFALWVTRAQFSYLATSEAETRVKWLAYRILHSLSCPQGKPFKKGYRLLSVATKHDTEILSLWLCSDQLKSVLELDLEVGTIDSALGVRVFQNFRTATILNSKSRFRTETSKGYFTSLYSWESNVYLSCLYTVVRGNCNEA